MHLPASPFLCFSCLELYNISFLGACGLVLFADCFIRNGLQLACSLLPLRFRYD